MSHHHYQTLGSERNLPQNKVNHIKHTLLITY